MQIWKIIVKMLEGEKVLQNQETMKAIGVIYNLPIFEANFCPYHAYSFVGMIQSVLFIIRIFFFQIDP